MEKFYVKRNFPIHIADELRADGFEITIAEFSILPQRLLKSDVEISEIKSAVAIAHETFAEAATIIANSSVNARNELVFGGDVLTSERLRTLMENFCFHAGAIAEDTIVACGINACDPHCQGHGALKAGEFILIDFFPRKKSSGYYADISRTFIKGKPTKEQVKLHDTVKFAHDTAISMVRGGVPARHVADAVFSVFDKNGYESDTVSDPPRGMFHALGHGFGLSIHEPPAVGLCDDVLQPGMVITIEPGLYYREIGGVRIEDDILVGDGTAEILSHIPHGWIID